MVVVRELVTRLGFQFDRSNLDKFQNAVIGFKTKMALVTAAITYAANKIVGEFADIAKSTLKLKDIAALAGIASNEFRAMRDAAQQLGISTDNFDKSFTKITQDIKLAGHGMGDLFKLFQRSNGMIRLPSRLLTDAENFRNFFSDTFKYINSLPTTSNKLYELGNIFGPDQAGDWLRIITQGADVFNALVEKNMQNASVIEKQENAASAFLIQLSTLGSNVYKIFEKITYELLPPITEAITKVNQWFDRGFKQDNPSHATEFAKEGGLVGWIERNLGENLKSLSFGGLGSRLFPSSQSNQSINSQPTINNNANFTFNVPFGTTENQAKFMAETIRPVFDDLMDEKTREIINNSPMME